MWHHRLASMVSWPIVLTWFLWMLSDHKSIANEDGLAWQFIMTGFIRVNCYEFEVGSCSTVTRLTHVTGCIITNHCSHNPDSKVHGAIMGPIWGRQVMSAPDGPHFGPMNIVIGECIVANSYNWQLPSSGSRIVPQPMRSDEQQTTTVHKESEYNQLINVFHSVALTQIARL